MPKSIDHAVLERHNLTLDEYDRIVAILGRDPNLTELGLFSVMWSEHCSYKSSRVHLRKLPTTGPRVAQGPGENAGAIDIGAGLLAVFKIESHNHPSFIEPYQGAATGVGGIIRDIFTMGARPIALLDALRFGSLDDRRTRRIVDGVVAGIGGYGNSIGIPTIGGETWFDAVYAGNPLVNVFCLGVAKAGSLVKGRADGPGNLVYYVGAKTGRDGIHGATMASAEFDERSEEKRPAVQVGDPFMEKLLLEACLEVMKSDAVIGVQDMGAAGLSCSTCEMAARAGTGVEIDVSLVPQREAGMTPYEIMLSESQERMLLVVKDGRQEEVERVFEKWDLHAVCVGRVTSDGRVRINNRGTLVADVPAKALADDAPLYDRPHVRPAWQDDVQRLDRADLGPLPTAAEAFDKVLASPNVASKRWIYRQFDHMVRTNTVILPGTGAPVVRLKGTLKGLAVSVDGNGRLCFLDPRRGAMLAVAEAARNVACAGAMPLGATNNLNFGNPERPDIMWQLVEAIEGIAEACGVLELPITGGNVSLYNETDGQPIYPTPVLGVVGLIEDVDGAVSRAFQEAGQDIVLLGTLRDDLAGTEYLQAVHGLVRGRPPQPDFAHERALHRLLVEAASARLFSAANDVAKGGLAVTLAEACFGRGVGAEVDLPPIVSALVENDVATLFSETPGVVVAAVAPGRLSHVERLAAGCGVACRHIGSTGGSALRVTVGGRSVLDVRLDDALSRWAAVLPERLTSVARG